jgi:flagellar biosynthesis protein FlhB
LGISPWVGRTVVLAVAVLLMPGLVGNLAEVLGEELRAACARGAERSPEVRVQALDLVLRVVKVVGPLVATLAGAGVAAGIVQTRGWVGRARGPKSGGLLGVLGAIAVGGVLCGVLWRHASDLAHLAGRGDRLAATLGFLGSELTWQVVGVGVIVAGVEVVLVGRRWKATWWMTRDEVGRERRETERKRW